MWKKEFERKQPKLRVMPQKQTQKEKRMAKIMEKIINYEYKKHKPFIDVLTKARFFIEKAYGIGTMDQPWDMILSVYIKQQIEKENQ